MTDKTDKTDVSSATDPKKTIFIRTRVPIPEHVIREQRRLSRMCGMPYNEYDSYEYEYIKVRVSEKLYKLLMARRGERNGS